MLIYTVAEGHLDQEHWVNFEGGDIETLHVVLDPLPPAVVRAETRLDLSDEVSFTLNDAQLDPASMQVLDDVAAWMKGHPEIRLLRVEGRADEGGRSQYNLALSQQRAEGVCQALITAGVASERLQAIGSGEALAREGPDRSVDFVVLVWQED